MAGGPARCELIGFLPAPCFQMPYELGGTVIPSASPRLISPVAFWTAESASVSPPPSCPCGARDRSHIAETVRAMINTKAIAVTIQTTFRRCSGGRLAASTDTMSTPKKGSLLRCTSFRSVWAN